MALKCDPLVFSFSHPEVRNCEADLNGLEFLELFIAFPWGNSLVTVP